MIQLFLEHWHLFAGVLVLVVIACLYAATWADDRRRAKQRAAYDRQRAEGLARRAAAKRGPHDPVPSLEHVAFHHTMTDEQVREAIAAELAAGTRDPKRGGW